MKLKTRIKQIADARKIKNAHKLSMAMGTKASVGNRLMKDEFQRIDLDTLGRVCEILRCSPNDIFVRADGKEWGRRFFPTSAKESA